MHVCRLDTSLYKYHLADWQQNQNAAKSHTHMQNRPLAPEVRLSVLSSFIQRRKVELEKKLEMRMCVSGCDPRVTILFPFVLGCSHVS